ncbi:3-isopropylmalate dehydratase small subunit [Ralstonia insidiosa]|uniref:3-isopropylmalate dehydratase small subunit n=1 Tax=Ralstonia insidiosa TaxID=190721 RepID=A0A848P3U4_9RALS|nr:3-isopropylmalate dehydratase small subunit [Ralstonia insidiosa]NMV40209.1 3-isopropylmalate dehydratase small subunit [Ralstonia insidiosa]
MQPFKTLVGLAAPLPRANLDTDVIIRIERLTTVPQNELGQYAFEAIRYLADGTPDPEFLPARPEFNGASILVSGANFGCGSSRESAVWALLSMGYRCVIAPSFGSIFYNNCFQNGVLPLTLGEAQVNALTALARQAKSFTVDLERQVIEVDGRSWNFAIDALRRDMLLQGLDEVGGTLLEDDLIRAWQAADRERRPWVWNLSGVQFDGRGKSC